MENEQKPIIKSGEMDFSAVLGGIEHDIDLAIEASGYICDCIIPDVLLSGKLPLRKMLDASSASGSLRAMRDMDVMVDVVDNKAVFSLWVYHEEGVTFKMLLDPRRVCAAGFGEKVSLSVTITSENGDTRTAVFEEEY
jgi:hypothetical protein